MPDQNVSTAEGLIEAWNREDWDRMEALFWPDAEAQAPAGWPEASDAEGWPAIKRQFERLKEAWSEDHIDIAGTDAIDPDGVLLHVNWRTRGKESGIDVDFESWIFARFREGKLYRVEFYLDREQAMRASGRTP